jgi:hypothetical protein
MAAIERPVYREWSPWPAWIQVVFWGTMVASMVAVAVSPGMSPSARMGTLLLLTGTLALVQWVVAGLTVRLYRDYIEMCLGTARLIKKRVRYEDIEELESVKYHPLMEFGGWGVRFSGKKRAWSARGDQAVVLHLADGIQLYVGSDKPQRLEERIRAIAGGRIGSSKRD